MNELESFCELPLNGRSFDWGVAHNTGLTLKKLADAETNLLVTPSRMSTPRDRLPLALWSLNSPSPGDVTVRSHTHVVHFTGDHPCNKDGTPIVQIARASATQQLLPGLVVHHSFSNKAAGG